MQCAWVRPVVKVTGFRQAYGRSTNLWYLRHQGELSRETLTVGKNLGKRRQNAFVASAQDLGTDRDFVDLFRSALPGELVRPVAAVRAGFAMNQNHTSGQLSAPKFRIEMIVSGLENVESLFCRSCRQITDWVRGMAHATLHRVQKNEPPKSKAR